MSFVVAVPEVLGSAATDLASLGSTISAANAAAASSTTGVVVAAGDEVSAAIAAMFSSHGRAFRHCARRRASIRRRPRGPAPWRD
jgi:hypothetical protein